MYILVTDTRLWLFCKWHLVRVWFNWKDDKWLCECHGRERVV